MCSRSFVGTLGGALQTGVTEVLAYGTAVVVERAG